MSNLQEKINKEYPLYDIQNSISKTDEYNGNEIQFVKRSAFQNGYEQCQKEYEEKLRWIPVAEKLPKTSELVIVDSGNYLHACVAVAFYENETWKYANGQLLWFRPTQWRSFF
jgi:hypothetical protein